MRRLVNVLVMVALAHTVAPPAARAAHPARDLFLPMVGRQAGVHPSNWYTAVWIHNPGAEDATARVYLLERGTANLAPPWVDVAVAAGATELVENAVETLFGRQVFGALRVTCSTQELLVSSRVYSREAGAAVRDSVGQEFAGVPASFAIGAGERTTILGVHQTQPSESSDFRYNFGFVETTGRPATVRVRALDQDDVDQGAVDLQVREWSQRQVAFRDHFPQVSTESSRLEVEVIAGSGRVIPYGSLIANGTQDPTTFEASVALAAGAVPAGAVMMFDLATCPAGWSELVTAQGRAIVAMPGGGTPGGTVGTALADLEDRPHTHVVAPGSVPTMAAGGHSHEVDPPDGVALAAGSHTHAADVPAVESHGVSAHSHTVPQVVLASADAGRHNHNWSRFVTGASSEWRSFDGSGFLVDMIGSSNGLDMSGEGTYPIALATPDPGTHNFYTDNEAAHQHAVTVPQRTTSDAGIHAHMVDPPAFNTAAGGSHSHDVPLGAFASAAGGSHFHEVNLPAAASSPASTTNVLPYIQLLACRKD